MKVPKFLRLLDDVLRQEQKEYEAKRKEKAYEFRHNPSSASLRRADGNVVGACNRKLYYKATGTMVPEDVETSALLKMDFGNVIHDYLARKLKKIPDIVYSDEVPGRYLASGLTKEISYRLDGLIATGPEYDNTVGGLEIKTVFGQKLDKIKREGPEPDHILQILCYFEARKDVSWFSLIYIGRDSGYRIEFNFVRDVHSGGILQEHSGGYVPLCGLSFAGIKDRFQELEQFIEKKEVPPRDFKVWLRPDGSIQEYKQIKGEKYKSDWQCVYCPYSKDCWSQPDAFKDSYNANSGS